MTNYKIRRLIGVGGGIVVGILWLTIGFLKTLLITVLAAIGWWLAGEGDLRGKINRCLEKINLPRG